MDELVAFIAAQLDEDEAAANSCIGGVISGRWYRDVEGNIQDEAPGSGGSAYVACGPYGGGVNDHFGAHIARHDPARVLREVAAKRAILAEYEKMTDEGLYHGLEAAIVHLATAWSDHPDYSAGWKP